MSDGLVDYVQKYATKEAADAAAGGSGDGKDEDEDEEMSDVSLSDDEGDT